MVEKIENAKNNENAEDKTVPQLSYSRNFLGCK